MPKEKFTFTPDWQLDLLNFITSDNAGNKALQLVDPTYFTLLTHAVIAEAIKKFQKKNGRIPGKTMLKEEILGLLRTRDYINTFSKTDKQDILDILDSLYHPVRDGDLILKSTAQWASFVELKEQVESMNLLNFEDYLPFSQRVLKAINVGTRDPRKSYGTFLIKDLEARQLARQDSTPIIPTPFRQINNLTNAGGYSRGSIIVLLDAPKKAKSATLINVARGYMRMKKKVFIADFENGEEEMSIRLEQSVAKVTKSELLTGRYDRYVKKVLRKYKRLGGEIFTRRYPAFSTIKDIQLDFDNLYQTEGIQFDDLIVDYAALMGSTTNKEDDNSRISDVYLDLANFAIANNLEHIWTANHIKREGEKREATQYKENDIAKCIDIIRHAQAIYGLNRNEYELENGIMRMELVVQRDGRPFGRALFNADMEVQRLDEMTQAEIQNYHKNQKDLIDSIETEGIKGDL